jgi:hypothetical protein
MRHRPIPDRQNYRYMTTKEVKQFFKKAELIWRWKYWPTALFYVPVMLYVLLIAATKAGKVFYFAAANPDVPLGGFSGDSKFAILARVPEEILPATVVITRDAVSFDTVKAQLDESGIQFPLIVKPDSGERGFLVKKLNNIDELVHYHYAHDMTYIIQEFISCPMEFSVLVHNAGNNFQISSFIQKEYMSLTGDGCSTIKDLVMNSHKSCFKKDVCRNLTHEFSRVLRNGEIYVPMNIGNLSYGTSFINLGASIDDEMTTAFKKINDSIGLFNYARYDLKCNSLADLKAGKFYVMEINGVKGEPLHIYSDGFTGLLNAYREVYRHWGFVYDISRRNMNNGAKCPGLREGAKMIWGHVRSKRRASYSRSNV